MIFFMSSSLQEKQNKINNWLHTQTHTQMQEFWGSNTTAGIAALSDSDSRDLLI